MSDAKYQRIAALAGPMKMGTIKLRSWMKELQEQLLAFPRARHDDLADAMKEGANMVGCKVRWGAAWHIDNIGDWDGTSEDAMNAYIDLRRSQGRRPFIDGPHFELMV